MSARFPLALSTLVLFLSTFCTVPAAAQAGGDWDRSAHEILIGDPDPAAGFVPLFILWAVQPGEAPTFIDLTTDIEVVQYRGSTAVAREILRVPVQTDGPAISCEADCGPSCGGLYVDGHINTMTCRLDGVAPGGFVDCDCGYWITSNLGGWELEDGDVIEARLVAAGTGLPEPDPTNDMATVFYGGEPVRYDREIKEIVLDVPKDPTAEGVSVLAYARVKGTGLSNPLDISSVVALEIDGERVAEQLVAMRFDNLSGSCEFNCAGGCGGLYVDGHINTMTCQLDGLYPGGGADCDCGYWLTADLGEWELEPGQTVAVFIEAANGAVPEQDTTNDIRRHTFDGGDRGWVRNVRHLALIPDPDATDGSKRLMARVEFGTSQTEALLDLSSEAVLFRNGVEIDRLSVGAVIPDAPLGCEFECGSNCGPIYIDGVFNTMLCHKDGPFDCDCGYWFTFDFGGIEPDSGDEFEVFLWPAASALPRSPLSSASKSLIVDDPDETHGWNRFVRSVGVVDDPTGARNVVAEVGIEFSDSEDSFHDLSFEAQLLVRGDVIGTLEIDASVLGNGSDNCEFSCDEACANFNPGNPWEWIAPKCGASTGIGGCQCGAYARVVFPADVGPFPLAELEVQLVPTPGALPELPGFDEDDEGSMVGTGTGPSTPRQEIRLEASPNPFNPRTEISFTLPRPAHATLEVYDVRGARVGVLADGELAAGPQNFMWDGTDVHGRTVASGVYFFRLSTPDVQVTQKALLVK